MGAYMDGDADMDIDSDKGIGSCMGILYLMLGILSFEAGVHVGGSRLPQAIHYRDQDPPSSSQDMAVSATWGVLFVGAHIMIALLLGVYITAP